MKRTFLLAYEPELKSLNQSHPVLDQAKEAVRRLVTWQSIKHLGSDFTGPASLLIHRFGLTAEFEPVFHDALLPDRFTREKFEPLFRNLPESSLLIVHPHVASALSGKDVQAGSIVQLVSQKKRGLIV